VYVFATIFASLCIIIGLLWDICWHISIGRDGLLSPPHLVIYLGAVISGVFSGFEILRLTFWARPHQKNESVRIWGFFQSSLGALFCVWGALAMLTSAPFDDWWHNTYGLDVTILSPPHTVLALGIISVQFGAMTSVISLKNRDRLFTITDKGRNRILFWGLSVSAAILLAMWHVLLSEKLGPRSSHHSNYYIISGILFPFLLIAVGRAGRHRWTITAVTAVYAGIMLAALWVIPLFPAEPKLGPILNHITHYQGFRFPLLLIVPAILLDSLMYNYAYLNDWRQSVILGFSFFASFFMVQWSFGGFLLESPDARNWFFGSHYLGYNLDPDWIYRYHFSPERMQQGALLVKGLGIALCGTLVSTRIGLLWGKWMNKIQR